jgi:hypothetical protein
MEITLKIILLSPPPGIDYGLQKGSGSNYEAIQKQRSGSGDLSFQFSIETKGDRVKDQVPDFRGPFVQGPINGRFIYIDIGALAGQEGQLAWRLKIPLTGISWQMLEQISSDSLAYLETRVPGTHKNGGPNCATVKPFEGWILKPHETNTRK